MDISNIREFASQLKVKYPRPIVAIIGAGDPNVPYHPRMGVDVGYQLARHVAAHAGTLLTGGMSGIGVDAYAGITKYRITGLATPNVPPFFVLIPEHIHSAMKAFRIDVPAVPFHEAEAYYALSMISESNLVRERIGSSLIDRRLALALTADIFIALNGTGGTLEEAATAIRLSKPVVVCRESGGVSEDLCDLSLSLKEKRMLLKPEDAAYIMNAFPPQFETECIVSTETIAQAINLTIERISAWKPPLPATTDTGA